MSKKESQIRPGITGPMGVKADAALYFVYDQMLFHSIDSQGEEQVKFVSTGSMREAFAHEQLDSGWLPPGVNRYGINPRGNWMIRWHNPAIYTLWLEGQEAPLRVPMPSLVWIGSRNNYYILASREKRFAPQARLYHAPLANVNEHGLICFGQEEHPDVARGGFEIAWHSFWASEFNDHHANEKSKQHPESINNLLIRLANEKARRYPLRDLISINTTLDAIADRLSKRGT